MAAVNKKLWEEDVEYGGIRVADDDPKKPLLQQQQKPVVVNVSDRVPDEVDETNGSTGMVLFSTFIAVCGSFEFGSCVGYSAPTQSAIIEDLKLSLAEYSMFGSILTIGAMIGAISSGQIADFIGRKGAMRMSAIFCITGWLAVYCSRGYLLLDTGRILTGYGIGVFSFVVPVYIAEIAPKNLRGEFFFIWQLMIVTGASLAFLMGTVVTWRTLALTGLIPCIVLLLGLCFIPESPRWLAKFGQEEEFRSSLQVLRGRYTDVSSEAAQIQVYVASLQILPKAALTDLIDSKYIRFIVIGVGLMVFQQFGGINGVGFYASETYASAGLASGKTGIILIACVQVPITVLGALLMDRSGRRPLIMISSSGTSVGCFLTGSAFFLKAHGMFLNSVPFLAAAGILIYIAAFSIGMGAVPWLIMSEIFPINIKGVAGSLVVLVNWAGAWAVSYTFNFLMAWSPSATFAMYSGFSMMTILFVVKLVPETKGKTLEEIQACINSGKH
ncbi:hypothetical protein MLD38_012035 [Melastoma candidum]|uniref:Uncharacterized protein n=1 Tax=Melastoma candidum TaxID=119954 RepID=A0ACB9R6B2_9MYRT|nr:hypothetical protein MLD38_012035 [Melastoma candidum]